MRSRPRRAWVPLLALATSAVPAVVRADLSLAASVGSGWELDPDSGRIATNLMLAPGFDVADDIVRFEGGLLADLPDVEDADFDVQLRPMVVLYLPPLPLYGRVVAGLTQVIQGPVAVAFGAAVGLRAAMGPGVAAFVEAGYIPRASGDDFENVLEGRIGILFGR